MNKNSHEESMNINTVYTVTTERVTAADRRKHCKDLNYSCKKITVLDSSLCVCERDHYRSLFPT